MKIKDTIIIHVKFKVFYDVMCPNIAGFENRDIQDLIL